MLSTNHAKLAIKVLALLLVAAISFFFAASWVPNTQFVKDTLESVEKSNNTVMAFSAATLSASLAITAFPNDFATPLADTLADMNFFFIAILAVLLVEKILVLYGIKVAFTVILPIACVAGAIGVAVDKHVLKSLAVRLCALGLAIAFVVPCSTHLTQYISEDLTAYVESTISATEDGANKLNEATENTEDGQNIFDTLSSLFDSAISGITDLLTHLQDTIRMCMNSIAILILNNFIMPILTFFVLKWVLKETFHIAIPTPIAKDFRQHREKRKKSKVGHSEEGPVNEE